jgi:hypothetical protein
MPYSAARRRDEMTSVLPERGNNGFGLRETAPQGAVLIF